HKLHFVAAPMVHWPEVMVTYDETDKVLFSADGFGKFGALDTKEDWENEARRYYIGIVGKYGKQVANLLEKASTLDIEKICPLHGPVLKDNLSYYLGLYNTWANYDYKEDGILVCYTSIYGHTKKAVDILVEKLKKHGANVKTYDLARCDMSYAVSDAFNYNKIILATTTYNADIFPFMREFIEHLTERNFSNKTIGLMENGSWAPMANRIMETMFEKSKNINILSQKVSITSALNETSIKQIDDMVNVLCQDKLALSNEEKDYSALNKIGYGLYVITSNDGNKDNGLIVNTVSQLTVEPNRVMVNINKANYSHDVIKKTGKMNVNCLDINTPFSLIKLFGFNSGKKVDKFKDYTDVTRCENGLLRLNKHINAYFSLIVKDYVDLGTHGMFICEISDAKTLSDSESLTYDYYYKHIKPSVNTEGKKGWVCKVCGYIYEGEELPPDFICPLCKHGVADFEKL
ncbi:MAG: flavin reductase, partial [Erysipelotrichaceae bacterium]|nr:flavin reductase [Erysipelotrichaceae bacterium]